MKILEHQSNLLSSFLSISKQKRIQISNKWQPFCKNSCLKDHQRCGFLLRSPWTNTFSSTCLVPAVCPGDEVRAAWIKSLGYSYKIQEPKYRNFR